MTQQRRASGKVAATVTFAESMSITLKKDNFLSNLKNKQRFLMTLTQALQNGSACSNSTTALDYETEDSEDLLV